MIRRVFIPRGRGSSWHLLVRPLSALLTLAAMLTIFFGDSATYAHAVPASDSIMTTVDTPKDSSIRTSRGIPSANRAPVWLPPLSRSLALSRPFEAPATPYTAGHRGIDLVASPGESVVSPASGTISFSGTVVDRPLLTIDTGNDTLLSMEPLASSLPAGTAVVRGQGLGETAMGGHCGSACLHLGVRVAGEYVSPMLFFGGIPPAILLPLPSG